MGGYLTGYLQKWAGYSGPPPLKSAKDQKTARCASIRSLAGYLAGHFQKWARISGRPDYPDIPALAAATVTFRGGVFIPLPLIFFKLLVLIKNKTLFGANLIARSPPSTTQSLRSLEDRRRRYRSTSPLKEFLFPLLLLEGFVPSGSLETLGGLIRDYSCLCGL
jgi:hypothetical protein